MEHTEVMKPETLDDLIQILHKIFESDRPINVKEIEGIMEAYKSNPEEWKKYAHYDKSRYTRKLIDKGNGKFNILIMGWSESQDSKIHDHTHSHCFMKMLQGQMKETRYDWPERKGPMVPTSERTLHENNVSYMDDTIGLHLVENCSHTETAASLHLYSPPYDIWQDFHQQTGDSYTVHSTREESTISQENN